VRTALDSAPVAEMDGMLSRSPTPGEFEFLKDQTKERG
jgi:hypothetical protein